MSWQSAARNFATIRGFLPWEKIFHIKLFLIGSSVRLIGLCPSLTGLYAYWISLSATKPIRIGLIEETLVEKCNVVNYCVFLFSVFYFLDSQFLKPPSDAINPFAQGS